MPMKVEWKCAMMECGEQYVVIPGAEQMQLLFVGNWDIPVQVL